MSSPLRKFVFTSHITFSVGWLGAVAVFFALAIAGLNSQNADVVRSACLAMDLSAWFVILPFCLTSLVTGVIQAAGTPWGLYKHYWIIVKLFLTLAGTLLLLLHLKPISDLAGLVAAPSFSGAQASWLRLKMVADSGLAVLLLVAITTISVYKPWGKIQGKQIVAASAGNLTRVEKTKRSWRLYALLALGVLILLIIWKHLLSGGMHGH